MELQKQEKKFVCKFCNKKYPCGKSFGGHIRTHMNNENNNSAEAEDGAAAEAELSRKRAAEAEAGGGQSSYGLRENPKKTKKFSDSGNGFVVIKEMIDQQEKFC